MFTINLTRRLICFYFASPGEGPLGFSGIEAFSFNFNWYIPFSAFLIVTCPVTGL
jgi:hypothetical protein